MVTTGRRRSREPSTLKREGQGYSRQRAIRGNADFEVRKFQRRLAELRDAGQSPEMSDRDRTRLGAESEYFMAKLRWWKARLGLRTDLRRYRVLCPGCLATQIVSEARMLPRRYRGPFGGGTVVCKVFHQNLECIACG